MKWIAKITDRAWYANVFNGVVRLFTFFLLTLVAVGIYEILLSDILDGGNSRLPAFLLLWLFSAYIVLPRIHRRLTKLYLPNYFIGRARTGDGLLGDPVNLAINGNKTQLIRAMKKAGWAEAEELNFTSSVRMAISSIRETSYPNAPVSSMFLFGEKQTLAFQKELNNNPRRRHHVRFWKTPKGWWLPGGRKADWLGAATFDKNVGLSMFTGQITHKVDERIDEERDYVVKSLVDAGMTDKISTGKHFHSGYHGRNGGGDRIITDGALPFITLKSR